MVITLTAPYKEWLAKHVAPEVFDNSRFTITLGAASGAGTQEIKIEVDLVWFILLYIDDDQKVKLPVVKELLQNPVLLQKFKETIQNINVKRVIEEFLIFNYFYLDNLKAYIDFQQLNVPLDFISHALFIRRGDGIETKEVSLDRLRIVNTVLDTDYKLQGTQTKSSQGAVLKKVLLMEDDVETKFSVALRLLDAGYGLFNSDAVGDALEAVALIDARSNLAASEIIQRNILLFKKITIKVAGAEDNNLADYYYWVKEDLDALRFVKEILGIELSPTS